MHDGLHISNSLVIQHTIYHLRFLLFNQVCIMNSNQITSNYVDLTLSDDEEVVHPLPVNQPVEQEPQDLTQERLEELRRKRQPFRRTGNNMASMCKVKLEENVLEECSICLDTPKYKHAVQTSCYHFYCKTCLDNWFKASIQHGLKECPSCRAAVHHVTTFCVKPVKESSFYSWSASFSQPSPLREHVNTVADRCSMFMEDLYAGRVRFQQERIIHHITEPILFEH